MIMKMTTNTMTTMKTTKMMRVSTSLTDIHWMKTEQKHCSIRCRAFGSITLTQPIPVICSR